MRLPEPLPDRLELRTSRFFLLVMTVLTGSGAILCVGFAAIPGGAWYVLGAVCASPFAWTAVRCLVRFVRPGVALALDHEGFDDHTLPWSPGRVRWSEVSQVELVSGEGGGVVSVDVRDPAALIERLGRWQRLMLRQGLRSGFGQVGVNTSSIDVPDRELLRLMEHYRTGRQDPTP
jgi:hypothetical protein